MDKKDIAILRIIDGLWETYEWVPVFDIRERLTIKLPLEKKIKQMEQKGLLDWRKYMGEPVVRIKERGKDLLAVWDFKKHGVIDDIGNVVGEGKEAVVVLGIKDNEPVALKFHRFSSAEFQKIKESLSYSAIKWWKNLKGRKTRPISIQRAKAQIEYMVLEKLYGKVSVPKPLGINRHVIAMEFLGKQTPAPLLANTQVEGWMKEQAIENYERAIKKGIVHGDMSKYNLIVSDKVYLIDWPQAVPVDFEGAKELEQRDRLNLSKL